MEEALIARGWSRPNSGGKGGRGGSGGPKSQIQKKENPKNSAGEILRCSSCDSIRHLLADCPDSYENLRKFRSKALASHLCEKESNEENKTREEEAYFTGDLVENLRKMSKEEVEVEDIILSSGRKEL